MLACTVDASIGTADTNMGTVDASTGTADASMGTVDANVRVSNEGLWMRLRWETQLAAVALNRQR